MYSFHPLHVFPRLPHVLPLFPSATCFPALAISRTRLLWVLTSDWLVARFAGVVISFLVTMVSLAESNLESVNVVALLLSLWTLVCDHSNESYWEVLSSGAVCCWQFCKMKFKIFPLRFEFGTLGSERVKVRLSQSSFCILSVRRSSLGFATSSRLRFTVIRKYHSTLCLGCLWQSSQDTHLIMVESSLDRIFKDDQYLSGLEEIVCAVRRVVIGEIFIAYFVRHLL